jgi:hypothetical protein
MKKLTAEWLDKAEDDLATARKLLRSKPILTDQVAFHLPNQRLQETLGIIDQTPLDHAMGLTGSLVKLHKLLQGS